MNEPLEHLRALDENNHQKYRDLMGADWEMLNREIELEELLAYFDPARFMAELDILERKMRYANTSDNPALAKHLRELFVEHLRYLATNFEADRRAIG